MIKSELAHILAKKTNIPEAAALEGLREILDFMTITLKGSDTIEVRGFGSFFLKKHMNRIARNPKTGEKIEIGQHRLPRFRPSKYLIRQLNNE